MHPEIGRERQGKSHVRSHERDPKENLVIDLEIGPDPVNDNRTVEEDHDPGSMMTAGGDTRSPEVETMMKMKVTMIEDQGKGMPTNTTKDQPSNDLLHPKKNTATLKRSAFHIMSDQPRPRLRLRLLKWTTSHLMGVAESSTAMSILRVPKVHYCRTTTCGMMILPRRNNRNHYRINFLTMFLLHLRHQPKPLLRLLLSSTSQAIQQDTTTNKPLNLLINLLHRQRSPHQEKRPHPRRTTIICSRPPRKSLPVNTNTRKPPPQLPLPLQQQYQ